MSTQRPPSPESTCYDTKHEKPYRLTFYGGFVRRVTEVAGSGGETVLYDQAEAGHAPFVLPQGQERPNHSHTFKISGGRTGCDISVDINDPHHRIDSIEIKLKPDAGASDTAVVAMQEGGGTIKVYNTPVICPPNC